MPCNACALTTKSSLVYKLFSRFFDFNKLFTNYKLNLKRSNERLIKHETFLRGARNDNSESNESNQSNESNNESNESNESNIQETNVDSNDEFKFTIQKLENLDNESSTDNIQMQEINEIGNDEQNDETLDEIENLSVVNKEVVRVINFDDENLGISLKEKLLFDEVRRIFELIDNVFRILLPFVFFIYIIVLMSNEK